LKSNIRLHSFTRGVQP